MQNMNRLRKQVTVLFVVIIVHIGSEKRVQASAGLVLPVERTTGLGCIPEGMTVSYECTVTDPLNPPVATTVWLGTAFNCPSEIATVNNRITLNHNMFQSGDAEDCGGLSAVGIGNNGNDYTSKLTLTATTGLNEMTVTCTLSGGSEIGNDTVQIGASPPRPQSAMVDITTSNSSFTFSWIPTSDARNMGGYMFAVSGDDCGNCVNTTVNASTTSVSCSDYVVNGQTCYFEVSTFSKDCGFISESSVNESVLLMVPSTPEHLMVMFSEHQILVKFMQPIVSHLAITYTVMVGTNFSVNFTEVPCDDTSRRCNLTIPNLSNSYNVSVVASNLFGSGPPALYIECNPADLGSNQTSLRGPGMVNVSNGLIHYSGVSPGSNATLQCNDGYRADSFLNRTCMFNGQWSEGAWECARVDEEVPACPLYCAVLVGVCVFGIMLVLIIVCVVIALYILKKYGRECIASVNTPEKVQFRAVNRESPTMNESSLSPVDMQPSKTKINVHRSEPSQVDTYANPEDFIKTPQHMQPQKNEKAEDQGKVLKPLSVAITDELPCAQYESIEVARPVKVTSTQPSQEMYSEVFDALPKGKSTIIVKKVTVTN